MKMICLDLTSPDPGSNLTLDESLLEIREMGGSEVLRIWESAVYFVAMGLSGREEREVHLDACKRDGIPILRRKTGGGTVLQGPGCLNYALILKIDRHPALGRIDTTHAYCLDRLSGGLRSVHPEIRRDGISDLTLGGMKFSGNAQRRLHRAVLYHGTLLHDFDLSLMDRYLKEPEKQPEYRGYRSHRSFLRNLEVPPEMLKRILRDLWSCSKLMTLRRWRGCSIPPSRTKYWPGGWDIPPGPLNARETDHENRRTDRQMPGK